jgi:transcriptional regulator with XRE-family HTH domain
MRELRETKEMIVARHPRPLDPDDGPTAAFALELRALRHRMGPTAPTIDQISEKQQIPRSTLYAAMSGTRVPTEDVLAALVRAWGGNTAEWTIRRAGVVQEIGLQRLREAKVGTVRASPPQTLSKDVIDYLELQAKREREEGQQRQKMKLTEEFMRDLREMRRKSGITFQQLGARAGISRTTLSEIERGRRLPSWFIIERILQTVHPEKEFQIFVDEWKDRWEQVHADAASPR